MNIGKARALFEQVASGEYHGSTVGEYLEAVKIVLDMETHNSISKKMIISVCKWLVEIAEKAVSPYRWIPVSERLPSKEERKEWIDNNLDGIGYLYPCLVTRYSSINPDRTKNNPYVAKHYFDGEDFLNAGEEVCSEYIIAWMPLPEPYKPNK
jgi:hypothetical protein